MFIPTLIEVKTYLGGDSDWSDDEIAAALASETAAQARVCRIPVANVPDLAEALCRRVAHNLAVRALPLGVQASITDAGSTGFRVGGTDAEVRRLEAPYRRLVIG